MCYFRQRYRRCLISDLQSDYIIPYIMRDLF